jgi:hypothetical protein
VVVVVVVVVVPMCKHIDIVCLDSFATVYEIAAGMNCSTNAGNIVRSSTRNIAHLSKFVAIRDKSRLQLSSIQEQ